MKTSFAKSKDWIQTYTGKRICPLDPDPADIFIDDIAHALSLQCRFTGHVSEPYSIAQHSVLVSQFCDPKDAFWGLMHDASEAYISDIARPAKHQMPEYQAIEERLMEAVAVAFDLEMPIPESVKLADSRLLMSERRDLLVPVDGWTHYADPYDYQVVPWDWRAAERMFLKRFKELNAERTTSTAIADYAIFG